VDFKVQYERAVDYLHVTKHVTEFDCVLNGYCHIVNSHFRNSKIEFVMRQAMRKLMLLHE